MTEAQRSAYDSWLLDPIVQSIIYSPANQGGKTSTGKATPIK